MNKNPNRTTTIEKRWLAEANRRFANLKAKMKQIPVSLVATNINDSIRFEIERFIEEFERLARLEIINSPWQNSFQTQAYQRGIEIANQSMKNALQNPPATFFGLIHAPSTISLQLPENLNELDFLHNRANTALERWLLALLADTRNILHEQLGIVSLDDIHEAIAERISVTTSYARRIASTEVAQAAQRATIKQTQELQAMAGEELELLWITKDDSHVRNLHARWHKTLMTPEQAARNVTISPFGCRCGLKPVPKGSINEEEKQRFSKERKQLLAKISN